ncbi:aminotransferase class V-fold PLP-dependent enzyme [Chakrabartyella piscis]|uniref:aminotransferase class V-fold PLP-dependent enzyme n=1 Tax=Chakrabartyella piscis TaxID=2918914 RepID=UPI002958630B|nr:aminotransferase class V-fold PLP-dependent enzyme [Chakrabartyella piscis]
MDRKNGILFTSDLQQELKAKFYYPDADPLHGTRLFFENSGGSLRLKSAVEAKAALEMFPDCPERIHERSLYLKGLVEEGTKQILEIMFGAKSGALITELTASQTMFRIIGTIMENVSGGNAVTTAIEHPSSHDAVEFYCKQTNREFRVIPASHVTGGIDPAEIKNYVDKDTVLLSVMAASNISGTIMDMEAIVKEARAINPDIYIVSDAVQHAPHCAMDVEELQVDAMNFAPYKFFGVRGCGFAYVSDRVAKMPHPKLTAKQEMVWELGTPSPGNFASILQVIDYVCEIGGKFSTSTDRKELYLEGIHRIHLQERALLYHLLEGSAEVPGLRHIKGVNVYVDTEDLTKRDLIVAMGIQGIDFTECVAEYQKRGVTVFERVNTSLYSKRIVEALGLSGAIRVSPLHCHGIEDIEAFLKITKEMASTYSES